MSIVSKALYKSMLSAGLIVKNKFEKSTRDVRHVNENVLLRILKKNSRSEIGKKYNFKKIKTVDDYIESVPLTEYGFYEQYIDRMMKGENDVLVSEKIEYFGHTSGTTGKQKLIPATRTSILTASKYMALLMNRYAYDAFKKSWNYGRGMLIADLVNTTYSEGGTPICSATAGGMNKLKSFITFLYTSPVEVMEIEDKETALYLHILFALEERNLLFISGVFISNIVDMFRVMEMNADRLIRDVKRGYVSSNVDINEDARKKINRYLKPNAARADELSKEFKKGFNGIARRIWPSLSYIATVTGANFSIYDDKLDYYTGSLPVYSPVYAATEATIGINAYVKKIQYVVIPDTAFYEFIPIEDSDKTDPKTLTIDSVKLGGIYEIVITNYAGLYRYRLGDVVKVVDFFGASPAIEFLYRKNQVLNMVSEKTNEEQLTAAVKNTLDKLKIDIVDYTTSPDNLVTPGRYIFYFEIRRKNKADIDTIETVLDNELKASNLAYARARKGRKLGKVKVYLVKPRTFDKMKEMMFKKGVSKNQVKVPRVIMNDREKMEVLNVNIV